MVLGRNTKNFPVQPLYVIRQEAPYNHVERKKEKKKKGKKRERRMRINTYERLDRNCQDTEKTAWWKEYMFVVCENQMCHT